MLSPQILYILLFTTLGFTRADSHLSFNAREQRPALIKSRIGQRDPKTNPINDSQLARHLVPPPGPRETIGEYFDKYASVLDNGSETLSIKGVPESEITGRGLIRGTGYLGSLWSGAQEYFNISISRCIQFADPVGMWTHANGTTTDNATLENINGDLRTSFKSVPDLSAHLNARLLENAAKAVQEAELFLNSTLCPSNDTTLATASPPPVPLPTDSAVALKQDFPDMTHDELRKLLYNSEKTNHLDTKFLEIDGYWTATLLSMSAGAGVAGALYKGFYNHNASSENVAIVCFTAAGLIFARGIIERLYMNGALKFVEASVISAFTAWFRQAVAALSGLQQDLRQVGADARLSGCLEEGVIENSVDGLPGYSQPQAGIIHLAPMGPVCPG